MHTEIQSLTVLGINGNRMVLPPSASFRAMTKRLGILTHRGKANLSRNNVNNKVLRKRGNTSYEIRSKYSLFTRSG